MIEWFAPSDWTAAWRVALGALTGFGGLILLARIAGLRSFSQMSAFDFVTTVAVGSMLGTIILTPSLPIALGLIGLAALFAIQEISAMARKRWRGEVVMDNKPLLLMERGEILFENLKAAKVTEHDLYAKLRSENIHRLEEVQAVVFETTGDVSVLHGKDMEIEPALLDNVRRSGSAIPTSG